jgi:hypothetical protein
LTRERLEVQIAGALQALVLAAVLWFALSNSHVYPLDIPVGREVRWATLALLACAALAYVVVVGLPRARAVRVHAPAGILLLLAASSVLWAPDYELSLGRAATFAALFAAGAGVAIAAWNGRADPLVAAIFGAAVLVALGGLLELWHDPDSAVVPATTGQGERYQGIGQNPNTMAALFAVALPLAVWSAAAGATRLRRAAGIGASLLLLGSIVASGSRGSIVAATAGVLVIALALTRRRALAVGAVAALTAVCLLLTQLPQPAETDPVGLNPEFGRPMPVSPNDVNARFPLENEIGFPKPGAPRERRTLFFSSGRTDAWEGALKQYSKRPLAGYGFGTEELVFVDRYYLLLSERIENSYISTLLQLGPIGLVLMLAAAVVPLWAWARTPSRDSGRRALGAACAGVVVSGLVLAATQSFLTSVGSPATAPFWLCVFMLAALAAAPGDREREGDESEEHAADGHREPSLDVMRREDQRVDRQQHHDRAAGAAARDGDG